VIGADNLATGRRGNMAAFTDHPDFTFWERDVCAPGLVEDARSARPDLSCVFHLAAVVSVPYSLAHRQKTMAVNLGATLTLHEDARRAGLPGFVFAGSAAEYGEAAASPLAETAASLRTVHLSPYGRAKFLASARIAQSGYGASLRCFNVYGPRQDASNPYSGVISRFIEAGMSRRPLTVFGDGRQTRDFVAVDDVAQAYLLAAGLTGPLGRPLAGIYNVGTGRGASLLELIGLLGAELGQEQEIVFLPPRQGDIRHSVADIAKFAAAGFRPRRTLREGLDRLVAWWRVWEHPACGCLDAHQDGRTAKNVFA
jgi:UDP-glucose 4-epimerase